MEWPYTFMIKFGHTPSFSVLNSNKIQYKVLELCKQMNKLQIRLLSAN